jgi:hypothetical protein
MKLWAWLNDDRALQRALTDIDVASETLLPRERGALAIITMAFLVLGYFTGVGAVTLAVMVAMWPALFFQQPLLVLIGAPLAPVLAAGTFKVRRTLYVWIIGRFLKAVTANAALRTLNSTAGAPVALPVTLTSSSPSARGD